jgi:hypothetical protein
MKVIFSILVILLVLVVFAGGMFAGVYLAGQSPAELPELISEKIGGTPETQQGAALIPDEALAAVIRTTLSMASDQTLTKADLARLRSLNASGKGVSNLAGMEYCTILSYLYLSTNNITDISPLASLTNLKHIYINGNQISDISPLVQNSGLGAGTTILLQNNNLDLSENSADLQNIKTLQARGVTVQY